jgi:hypothetical protein
VILLKKSFGCHGKPEFFKELICLNINFGIASLQNFNKFGQVVKEEKLFKEIVETQTMDHGPSQKHTWRTLSSGELTRTKSYQVSIIWFLILR